MALAEADMDGYKLWNYEQTKYIRSNYKQKLHRNELGGRQIHVWKPPNTNNYCAYVKEKKDKKTINIEQNLANFIGNLQLKLKNYYEELSIYSTYRREDLTFHASTNFMCKAWRDWAIIDWGEEEGELPCHLMGFVDLRGIPEDFSVSFEETGELYAGIFAIVEAAQKVTQEPGAIRSELFVPYDKEVKGFTGRFVSHNKYYLADVEAIVGPAALIPDIGGPVNRYLHLKDRSKWKKDFTKWLEIPSTIDTVYSSDDESDANDRENYEEISDNGEEENN